MWEPEQKKSFTASKDLLTSPNFFTHFNSSQKQSLSRDALGYGLGAVLAQKMPDGSKKPISYASRTLTQAERNYSQLKKEGLTCIFGIERFHDYLFSHALELMTDYKPLLGLLKIDCHVITSLCPNKVLVSVSFWVQVHFGVSEHQGTCQRRCSLSRLFLPIEPATTEFVLLAEHLADSPVTADDICAWARKDPKLSNILQYLQQKWPSEVEPGLERYSSK